VPTGALAGPEEVLDRLTATVRDARAMPMSASCVVNRAEVLALLDELRARLPEALDRAEAVLDDRAAVVEDGQREAEQVLASAQAERSRLLSRTEVLREAEVEAAAIVEDAVATAARTRAEADDYTDTRLANFEVVLHRLLEAVGRGRQNLSGAQVLEALRDSPGDDRPLPG
jgi:cell division septum initiation protein DivIVA